MGRDEPQSPHRRAHRLAQASLPSAWATARHNDAPTRDLQSAAPWKWVQWKQERGGAAL